MIGADLPPEDLLRPLVGISHSQGAADWQATALRLADVPVDRLRKR